MPHHAVIKEDRASTKIWIVFDATASRKAGRSLNDNIETGPNLNPDIDELHAIRTTDGRRCRKSFSSNNHSRGRSGRTPLVVAEGATKKTLRAIDSWHLEDEEVYIRHEAQKFSICFNDSLTSRCSKRKGFNHSELPKERNLRWWCVSMWWRDVNSKNQVERGMKYNFGRRN